MISRRHLAAMNKANAERARHWRSTAVLYREALLDVVALLDDARPATARTVKASDVARTALARPVDRDDL